MAIDIDEEGGSAVGQGSLPATTLTDVYVGTRKGTNLLAFINVCNRGAATTFRISYAPGGAADDVGQYLYYDTPIAANDSFLVEYVKGIPIRRGDVIRAYAGTANLSILVSLDVPPDPGPGGGTGGGGGGNSPPTTRTNKAAQDSYYLGGRPLPSRGNI